MIDAVISDTILDILAQTDGRALDTATLARQANAATEFAVDNAMTLEHCDYLTARGYLARQAHPLDPARKLWSITPAGRAMATEF